MDAKAVIFCVLLMIILTFTKRHVQATPGLVPPEERTTGLGCIPEGRTVSYECTVTDPRNPPISSTTWRGDSFDCPSAQPPNSIGLQHSTFGIGSNPGICGDFSAAPVGFDDTISEYTSNLTFNATIELNGTTIECTLGGSDVIGSDNISVGAIPPSVESITFPPGSLLEVVWIQPSDLSNVDGYRLDTSPGGCGCADKIFDSDTTRETCSGEKIVGQTCSIGITTLSQDCRLSSAPVVMSVTVRAPSSPSQLAWNVVQLGCFLQRTRVEINWSAPLMANGPPVPTYRVVVTDMSTELFRNTTTGTSIIVPGSMFTRAGEYTLNVSAFNPFGESQATMATINVAAVNLTSTSTTTMISATLMLELGDSSCSGGDVTVFYQQCAEPCQCSEDDRFTTNPVTRPISSSSSISITLTENLTTGAYYCYRSEVMNGGVLVGFENGGSFRIMPPEPPLIIQGAMRVVQDPPTYQCINSAEGFNGVSSQAVASFNPTTGVYSLSPCSLHVGIIIVICIIVVIAVVVTIIVTILILCWYKKNKEKGDEDTEQLKSTNKPAATTLTPDTLYADPNTIEHQTTAGGDEYAMVDMKGKKKDKQTQEAALYQDPNTIEHETAPSGETYAVVDKSKPKRGSKKREPDVVPPQGAEGLNYADIDVAAGRRKPKPAPQHQTQDPGHVEYSTIGQEQARL